MDISENVDNIKIIYLFIIQQSAVNQKMVKEVE